MIQQIPKNLFMSSADYCMGECCVYLPVIKVVQSIWDNFMCYCPAIIDTVSHSWYLALTSKIHPGVASKAWPRRFSLYTIDSSLILEADKYEDIFVY